ncbi:MAG: 4Fe-4S binding protein [Deltaproteobacteria bacterium]|nr:4Fe-4S binding protein [Deltaproteobacteria bacterium]
MVDKETCVDCGPCIDECPEKAINEGAYNSMEKQGKVVGVCLSQRKIDTKKNVGKGFLQKGIGLVGNSHAGTEKEISLLAMESIDRLCWETGILAGSGCFAENITVEGIDLISLPIGAHLQVGEAKLMVIQIGKDPSQVHTYNYQGHSILPKEGIFCKVIESGEIKVGDIIRLIED